MGRHNRTPVAGRWRAAVGIAFGSILVTLEALAEQIPRAQASLAMITVPEETPVVAAEEVDL